MKNTNCFKISMHPKPTNIPITKKQLYTTYKNFLPHKIQHFFTEKARAINQPPKMRSQLIRSLNKESPTSKTLQDPKQRPSSSHDSWIFIIKTRNITPLVKVMLAGALHEYMGARNKVLCRGFPYETAVHQNFISPRIKHFSPGLALTRPRATIDIRETLFVLTPGKRVQNRRRRLPLYEGRSIGSRGCAAIKLNCRCNPNQLVRPHADL